MATQLEQILASTRRDLEHRKQTADMPDMERRAAAHTPRGFAKALRNRSECGLAIIAELKKASPSRGLIRADFEAAHLAADLESAGAAALSVLTDEPYFHGSLSNLRQASAAARIPCLRKDFIVDEFQILEARAACADAILLIAAALDDASLRRLRDSARVHGLDVLCEIHSAAEAARVSDLGCEAIGVNNRNLSNFEVRLDVSLELADCLPREAVHVAESGIRSAADLNLLRAAGFDAFLIGESLMRQRDPGEALSALLAATATAPEVPA